MATAARSFCRRLPKIELHAHLTGSISRSTLHDIWEQKKLADPELLLQDPLLAIPPGKVDYDLSTFFPLFSSYIYELCSDLPSIEHSTRAVLQDFEADNVVYLELRTTPRAVPRHDISKDLYIRTVLECIQEHEARPHNRLETRLILSVDRRNSLEEALEVVELAVRHQRAGVVGVDLCGDPSKGPITTFRPAFAKARAAGLKVTLHFAEAPASSTPKELWELLSWQPDRIGHVIHVDDALKSAIVGANIGVELCLSCNVHAKMITGSYGEHHFGWWRQNHVGFALCTDDVGVFCSPLSEEYYLAAKHFGLTEDDIKQLCHGAIEIIFGSEDQKARLKEIYSQWEQS